MYSPAWTTRAPTNACAAMTVVAAADMGKGGGDYGDGELQQRFVQIGVGADDAAGDPGQRWIGVAVAADHRPAEAGEVDRDHRQRQQQRKAAAERQHRQLGGHSSIAISAAIDSEAPTKSIRTSQRTTGG